MITTVNGAFDKFMKDVVNLDKEVVSNARSSMDNLLNNIDEFSDDDFFHLWNEINIQYGSFARKTKCRKLDDIDLMIGISADGATYDGTRPWNDITITASGSNRKQIECSNDDGTLNSTKVLNKFKDKLEKTRDYSRSDLHKNKQAVTLTLLSREWNFDIVPCFQTVKEADGRSYYLIPNGDGNWLKTDPKKDRDCVFTLNSQNKGKVTELIRLCKKWNKVKNAKTISSYVFETLIIHYCLNVESLNDYIDIRFRNALKYISNNICSSIFDLKGIQGDINDLSYEDRLTIKEKAVIDFQKAVSAYEAETKENNHQKAINIWRDIFGEEFPKYGD